MVFWKWILFIILFFLLSYHYQVGENTAYSHQQKLEHLGNMGNINSDMFDKDPVINLLGKSFDQIKRVLGDPDEQGYSEWLGPHYYILFRHKEGSIRFCSPEPIENKIAVSIILGPGREVLGVKVGMPFLEIIDILGVPDFGPELGIDNQYYINYFFEEIKNQTPEIFLSFTTDAINSHTQEAFVKWEAFEYEQIEMQAQR